jgi:hypothetical protein
LGIVRVVAFNTAEKWSQDVSADVAHEFPQRCDLQLRDIPFFLQRPRGPLQRLPIAPADPLDLIMPYPRPKPPAGGIKASYPGFIEPALATL